MINKKSFLNLLLVAVSMGCMAQVRNLTLFPGRVDVTAANLVSPAPNLPGFSVSNPNPINYVVGNAVYQESGSNTPLFSVRNFGIYNASGTVVAYLPTYTQTNYCQPEYPNCQRTFFNLGKEMVIVPAPGSCRNYYVIYNLHELYGTVVMYALIQVNSQNQVSLQSSGLLFPSSPYIGGFVGGLAASVRNANGNHDLYAIWRDRIKKFTITNAGISFVQDLGVGQPSGVFSSFSGELELSNDGAYLAWGGSGKVFRMPLSGSNAGSVTTVNLSSSPGGIEFNSTNSNQLFTTTNSTSISKVDYSTPTPTVTTFVLPSGVSSGSHLEQDASNRIFGITSNGKLFYFSQINNSVTTTTITAYSNETAGLSMGYSLNDQLDGANYYDFYPANCLIGERSNALQFDGVNDYLEAPAVTNFNSIGTGNFTMEARIKVSSATTALYPIIMSNRTGHETGVVLFLNTGTDSWANGKLWLNIAGTNYPCSNCPDLRDNQCHHVAVVNEAGMLYFYIDGVLNTTRPVINGGNISSSGVFRIGHDVPYPGEMFFKGEIGEVRLWNIARTADQINASKSASVAVNQGGLVAQWRLNEGTGQIAYCLSSTPVNAVLGSTTSVDNADPIYVNTCTGISKKLGSSFENPIVAGTLAQGGTFSHTANNTLGNGLDNDYGQQSEDAVYSFTLTQTSEVTISTCASDPLDTYLHVLTGARQLVTYVDDYGPVCSSSRSSSMKINLNAGTYFIVSEGYSTYSGNIALLVSVGPSTGTPLARMADFGNEEISDKEELKSSNVAEVLVSPNPITQGVLFFGYQANVFELRNTKGDLIRTGNNQSELSVDGLAKGMYFLSLDGKIQKVIVQ